MTPEEKLIVERLRATYADVDEMEKVFDIVVNTLALREAEIERLKADRDKWEQECKIAYKAFNESNVKQIYESMHQQDVEEHNRLMHEIAVLRSLVVRAAEALEAFGPSELMQDEKELIAELRKAAQ